MNTSKPLFSQFHFWDISQQCQGEIFKEIESIDPNIFLNTNVHEWCNYFETNYKLKCPQIDEENIQVDYQETQIKINRDSYGRGPYTAKGTAVSYFIPFKGDSNIFECEPSTCDTSPPYAQIKSGELVLTYTQTEQNAIEIKSRFDSDLRQIRQYLGWLAKDIDSFNNSISINARQKIESRYQRLLKDQSLVAELGFPVRRRENAPQTYAVPAIKRKIPVSPPSANTTPFVPEPTLDIHEYEHILSVISNMVLVMERSPQAFKGMGEEDLRQHFLVQLNGQYEGQATGETFNFNGKTDILIRVNGKNIFIAECKFWKGEEKLKETLNQLLGYTSWRDTKIALLIFNRNKDFSSVVQKIPDIIKSHSNFLRKLDYKNETGFRCLLHHPSDLNRELTLTTLAFNVP